MNYSGRVFLAITFSFFILFICDLCFAKTVTGTINSLESGSGGIETVITVDIGSSSGLQKGSVGTVYKGDEPFAYVTVLMVSSNESTAKVTKNSSNYLKVTPGLRVSFNVRTSSGKDNKTKTTPPSSTRITGCNISSNFAWGTLKKSGDS